VYRFTRSAKTWLFHSTELSTGRGVSMKKMNPDDLALLRSAMQRLENPSLAARLTKVVGRPLQLLEARLPAAANALVVSSSRKAIEAAVSVAKMTLADEPHKRSRQLHTAVATISGAVGGAFGLAALPIEIPASTVIITRAILETARMQGEDISDPAAALSCVEVLAFGGQAENAPESETSYFAVRGMLAASVTEAARFIAQQGLGSEASPVLVRFISQVASRFGFVLSQKIAAQAIPLVGALGGAGVNYIFAEHFQEIGQAHFTVRKLERTYGAEVVRAEYERITASGFDEI
jgi:EcsC protein family